MTGRPMESRDALHSFVHDTAIPSFVAAAAVLLALSIGAFALRGCRIVGVNNDMPLIGVSGRNDARSSPLGASDLKSIHKGGTC